MADDVIRAGPWMLPADVHAAVLLDEARAALRRGEAATAAVLAEEVLDHDPDDLDALRIVADAAPRYGHGEVGMLAAEQAGRRGARTATLTAAARLAACQVDGALESADHALADDPEDARAHAVRAQALEFLGRADEADRAYAQAYRLRPAAYPRALAVPAATWDTLVHAARADLVPELRDALRRVDLVVDDLPDLVALHAIVPPPNPTSDGVLFGQGGEARIVLYRRNLARGATSLDDVTARITHALEGELEALLDREEDSCASP
jgi:tetratricopeptide (TPR) repeat protein